MTLYSLSVMCTASIRKRNETVISFSNTGPHLRLPQVVVDQDAMIEDLADLVVEVATGEV